jgi:DNA polymerase I-like protein with 3'-5' exonuclease and polymerase domains
VDLTEGDFDLPPINIRAAFVASSNEFVLISSDYSQVELRVLAHLSGDSRLIEILRLAHTGAGDVFSLISQAIHGSSGETGSLTASAKREQAKRCVYGIVYGISAFGLSEQLKEQGVTIKQCQALMDSFFCRFPQVKSFISKCQSDASNNGFIQTIGGRKRTIAGIHSSDFATRSHAFRMSVNSSIQGSAADIIKVAMISFADFTSSFNRSSSSGPGSTKWVTLLAQIHDELLIECHVRCVEEVVARAKDLMEKAWRLSVPLQVRVVSGKSWGGQN